MQRKNSFFISDEIGKTVEIFIQCRKLLMRDLLQKNNPFVVMKMKRNKMIGKHIDNDQSQMWIEVGRTNVIQDNLNPNFTESFIVNYKFEEYQPVLFEVYHYDSPSKSTLIGQAESSLGEIVKQTNQILVLNLADENNKIIYNDQKTPKNGKIYIRYDEVFESNDICMFQLSTTKMHISKFIINFFLRIYRKTENGDPILVYQSTLSGKHIKNKIIKIKGQKLCNSDYNVPIVFEIWNKGFLNKEELVGYFEASVLELKEKMEKDRDDDEIKNVCFNLKQDKNRKNSISLENNNIGQVIFHKTEVITLPSFLDYLRGGTQINLVLGIDFTASNGHPSTQSSLHYIDKNNNNQKQSNQYNIQNIYQPFKGKRNQYQRAIQAVGTILLEYDSDKLIPTYGFGAVIKGKVEHAFNLNNRSSSPDLFGINSVMEEYSKFLNSNVEFSGPTYFSPLIQKCIDSAQESLSDKREDYFVLLLLTDGMIHDMEQTKRLIVDCAKLPISIIIVGVGDADFTDMKVLDGDDGLIDSRGKKAQRDLVQFVAFKDYEGNDILLQKEVLQELPDQIVEYYLLCKRLPEGFDYSPHINYIEYTRIVSDEKQNQKSNLSNLSSSFLFNVLLVIFIGLILLHFIF